MKLKNKKTGEIRNAVDIDMYTDSVYLNVSNGEFGNETIEYHSLAELNEEWEDCEEPKTFWAISWAGEPEEYDAKNAPEELKNMAKQIGNYFETQEEAEKAVEKLKAWTRLEELETEILGGELRDMPSGGKWQTVNVKLNIKATKETMLLLDLLFRGEE